MNVEWLPLACPLCDGKGVIRTQIEPPEFAACGFCRGAGLRPTDSELAQRRLSPTTEASHGG